MLERRNNNMIGNFNEEAQTVLMNAKKEMLDLGHPYIGTEHLLLSILKTNSNITERLNNYDLYYDNFKEELSKVVGTSKKKSEYFLYTPLLRKIIESAIMDSKDNNDGEVTIEHLFFSMLEEGEGIAIRILIGMDIISLGDFSVSNFNGKTQFTFRIPSQAHTDYVQVLKNQIPVTKDKTYPNDLCPCGSGKKYKKCCGRNK